MGIELRCASCGLGFVAEDLESTEMPCPGCGSSLGSATSPIVEHQKKTTKPPSRPPQNAAVRAAPLKTATPTASSPPPKAASIEAPPEVVCPRCSLHFTPRTAKPTKPHTERRTVLVVEDMDYFRGIARDALEPQYVVVEAPQGAVIVELPPDHSVVVVQKTSYYYYGGTYYVVVKKSDKVTYKVVQAPVSAVVNYLPKGTPPPNRFRGKNI